MDNKEFAIAQIKNLKGSAQKAKLVADMIKGMEIEDALDILKFVNYRNAPTLYKVLKNALNNAEAKNLPKPYKFEVSVGKGRSLRRYRFKSHGHIEILNKGYCNISVKISTK